MLIYFLIGAAAGVITGVPIGPVNVAVIDAAYRHSLRRALAVGLGGAIGDGLFALLGVLGMGPFLERYPSVPPVLYALSSVLLVVYGVITVRSRPMPPVGNDLAAKVPEASRDFWSGAWLGFALIILNPAAVITWVFIVGSHMQGVDRPDGLAGALGVSCGSFAWFSFVGYLTHHGRKLLGSKGMWTITRVVGYLLIGYALYLMSQAIRTWFF